MHRRRELSASAALEDALLEGEEESLGAVVDGLHVTVHPVKVPNWVGGRYEGR